MAPNQARRIPLAPADDAVRHSSAQRTEVLMPNLNQVQRDSFDWFMKQGLKEVFAEISPIYAPQHDTEA